jgi:hypothetical protein
MKWVGENMGGRATALDIPLMKIGNEYAKDGIF